MSKTRVGVILVLLVSLVIGVVAGLTFLSLFKSQVPPAALSDFTKAASPVTFVGSGVIFGVIIAAWSLIVAWVSPRFGAKKQG